MKRRSFVPILRNVLVTFGCAIAAAASGAVLSAEHSATAPQSTNPFGPPTGGPRTCENELGYCDKCCDEVTVRGEFETWANTSWTPDLRPIAIIQCFSGSYFDGYAGNMRGLNPSWWGCSDPDDESTPRDVLDEDLQSGANGRPDAFDWLLKQMQDRYDQGYRRFMLYLPAGNPHGQYYFPAAQWGSMPEWRKHWFSTEQDYVMGDYQLGVKGWAAALSWAEVEVSVYQGFQVGDPCDICQGENAYSEPTLDGGIWYYPCDGAVSGAQPDTTDLNSMCACYWTIRPWADEVGITTLWFDATSPNGVYQEFVRVGGDPDFSDMKLGGEAFPVGSLVSNSPYYSRAPLLSGPFSNAPWMCTLNHAEQDYLNGPQDDSLDDYGDDNRHEWVAPEGSEAIILIGSLPSRATAFTHNQLIANEIENAPLWDDGTQYDRMYNYYVNVARGFVLTSTLDKHYDQYSGESASADFVERLYGMGTVHNPADFDGDGFITGADWDTFLDHYARSIAFQEYEYRDVDAVLTFYHGDVDNSGVVDGDDFDLFYEWWDSTTPATYNLGDMLWNPNDGQYLPEPGTDPGQW